MLTAQPLTYDMFGSCHLLTAEPSIHQLNMTRLIDIVRIKIQIVLTLTIVEGPLPHKPID